MLEVVSDVLLRRECGDEDVVEALARVLGRGVVGGALKVENVRLAIRVQASCTEGVEVVVQPAPLLWRDRVLVLERDDVNDGHGAAGLWTASSCKEDKKMFRPAHGPSRVGRGGHTNLGCTQTRICGFNVRAQQNAIYR